MLQVSVISIGDELLLGQTINTNASWIGARFRDLGIKLQEISIVADSREAIFEALTKGVSQNNLLLLTGGLGPTRDDITKHTLMEFFKSEPVFHENIWEIMVKIFSSRGQKVLEMNRSQAIYPHNCKVLPNKKGTAQGMWFEMENCIVVSMPGVPYEMKHLMDEQVIPAIRQKFNLQGIQYRVLMTAGAGESQIAARLEDFENSLPKHIKLAYLPEPGVVKLRLTSSGLQESSQLDLLAAELKTFLGEWYFSDREEKLEEFIHRSFLEKGYTLSLAESCTGGYLSHLLTSIAGSSAYYEGSAVVYSYAMKEKILGVKHETLVSFGAVSEEAVTEMAEGMRKLSGTTFAISVSGIAGPGGATSDKPVGTVWIAIAGPSGTQAQQFRFFPGRAENIRVFANAALNMLRHAIAVQQS